jgi:hypothetical protein
VEGVAPVAVMARDDEVGMSVEAAVNIREEGLSTLGPEV